jgi:hypothetical protein
VALEFVGRFTRIDDDDETKKKKKKKQKRSLARARICAAGIVVFVSRREAGRLRDSKEKFRARD